MSLFLGSSTESVTFTQRKQDVVFKRWMQWPLEDQMLSQAVMSHGEVPGNLDILNSHTGILSNAYIFVCYGSSGFLQIPLGHSLFKSFHIWIILTKNWYFCREMLLECNFSSYSWYKEWNNWLWNYRSLTRTITNCDGWKHFRTQVSVWKHPATANKIKTSVIWSQRKIQSQIILFGLSC